MEEGAQPALVFTLPPAARSRCGEQGQSWDHAAEHRVVPVPTVTKAGGPEHGVQ